MKWWDRMPWSSFSKCWAFSQLFHSPLSLSSRGFLVPLRYWINLSLESPLDCKIKPISPKWNQPWIFIGRANAEAETPLLWPPDAKNWLLGKDPDAGKDWRQEEKGTTGWNGWMAWPTQWTWMWVNSGSWWWTGRPGVLWSMGLQRVGHDWATEQNWTE